jgi:RNA polymerase sigma-70 factor (ECF subfamily)
MAMTDHEEGAWLVRVAEGDRAAFERLYRGFYPRLFGYVLKVCRRPDLVEEIVNDTLLAVWRSAGRFDGRSRVSTWIFGIAYRKTLKRLARRDAAAPAEPPAGVEPAVAAVGARRLERRELRDALDRALAALPPEQRAVVELAYFHELPYAEIAEIVGCPVNTVKTRMFHARRRLRERLPELGVTAAEGR